MSVYIFYTDNVPGINCLRLHCFSCMGFFNCSYRKPSFAIQTQEKPPQIPIRGPNSFALNWGSIKSFWKKKKCNPKPFQGSSQLSFIIIMVLVAKIICLTLLVIKACVVLCLVMAATMRYQMINYNFEASYWIRDLVLSGKNVGKT